MIIDIHDWLSNDDGTPRQRYTKSDVKRGQTELVQCRADAFLVRRVDEIVASRLDPIIKTRSDVLQDAIALWLEDWDERYPDQGGALAYQSRLERMSRRREYRESFIDTVEEQLELTKRLGDISDLRELSQILSLAYTDFKTDAPPTSMKRMDDLMQTCQRLITESQNAY